MYSDLIFFITFCQMSVKIKASINTLCRFKNLLKIDNNLGLKKKVLCFRFHHKFSIGSVGRLFFSLGKSG